MRAQVAAEHPEAEALAEGLAADAEALLDRLAPGARELSILLCGDAAIRDLNAAWRGRPAATDVLSFPQGDDAVLGDIVISLDTAARQAAERGHGLRDEVRILLVHGLLHLLGYDHERGEEAAREMARREQAALAALGWTGAGLLERVAGDAA